MEDSHHHHHRPQRLSVPPRTNVLTALRHPSAYPLTPTPTPSKTRLSRSTSTINDKSSIPFLFLLLFSLRSLYSVLPFLRSSPSFSLFPFSFLVSLLSFLLTLSFSLYSKHPRLPLFSLSSLSQSQVRHLLFKSLVLGMVFLLRFQALRYCGTAAMILAELSGNMAFRFWKDQNWDRDGHSRVRGFFALFSGLFLLSVSWDRMDCFPLSYSNLGKIQNSLMVVVDGNCLRIVPMLLPFLSGFLGCYERDLMNWGTIRQLGRKRVQLISLFFTTSMLFFPAIINMLVFEAEGGSVSIMNLGWSLANTVLFGVLLNEWYNDEKRVNPSDSEKEFLITFLCTLVLELVYFPELSLWGLLICGFLLWVAIQQLNWARSRYVELGAESSETFLSMVMRPIRHVLSERKSRKIALFLMINTGYMVVEFVAGFMSNSLGLISDACHMLFDCAALAIGLYASYISRLPANSQFNYGRGRFEVLSGYVNAVLLVLVGALIVLESLERILDPQEISTNSLLAVSIGGLLVNVVGLIFFHEEHHHAHGGSCSHSHSDSHSHTHHDHDHVTEVMHHDGVLVGESKNGSHDMHGESHQHDHVHSHGDHDHSHTHGHHDHSHHHGNHDHDHSHGHHDHDHSHAHHDHDHSHAHHDHSHAHHDHSHSHDQNHSCGHHDQHHEQGHHIHHDHNDNEVCKSIPTVPGVDSCSHSHHLDSKTESSHSKKPRHQHIDHNMEGIFLHVLADTLGSVGVVISTLLIKYKGWLVADPACSIFISVLIVSSVIPLLRNSAEVLLQRVPRAHEQDLKAAVTDVMKIKGVSGIQNLHVWSLTNTDVISTLHLRISSEIDQAATKARVMHVLEDAGVKDLTLQVEGVKSL
ncbi:hypothetical protein SOVF_014440 [Spinacia oleracea]|uniref:Cation efflux protein transmembrane domain-containing protein n=1 Tax=Spinacia oleracea TaxID=3562 RepID=A0A9R0J0D2_SPIOL|nr:uncharacterized protein LOC110798089 [Spinacia oleracea]KNA24577.1 hypothetical protein SOVF_014440 [Spinacia oleracea]